jgi:type IV secretion system protein VirB2
MLENIMTLHSRTDSNTMKIAWALPCFMALLFILPLVFPDLALAQEGVKAIDSFSAPLQAVVGTITGKAGQYISIAAMGICGIMFIMNKDDISGGFKVMLTVVFGISFICFASSIVTAVFNFTGAMI